MPPKSPELQADEFIAILDKTLGSKQARLQFLTRPPRVYGRSNIRYAFRTFIEWWADRPLDWRKSLAEAVRADLPPAVRRYIKLRDKYESDIVKLLNTVRFSTTGGPLFREITARSDKDMMIIPYLKEYKNAEVIVDPEHPEAAIALGFEQRESDGKLIEDVPLGTGTGTTATVLFTPDMWDGSEGPGTRADEVLFHEMVHALRVMDGVQYFGRGVDKFYENKEEYLAVVLTNIYLAEKHQKILRADHFFHDDKPKLRILPHPEKFLDNFQDVNIPPRELIGSFKYRQPTLYEALAAIPKSKAWFNPIREYKERSPGWEKKMIDL